MRASPVCLARKEVGRIDCNAIFFVPLLSDRLLEPKVAVLDISLASETQQSEQLPVGPG